MIVAGFGFRQGAGTASLRAAFDLASKDAPPVTHLATLADKAAALAQLAEHLQLPIVALYADDIRDVSTPTRSTASLEARNVGSVSEACALAAIPGADARLIVTRHLSPDRMATCALAMGGPA